MDAVWKRDGRASAAQGETRVGESCRSPTVDRVRSLSIRWRRSRSFTFIQERGCFRSAWPDATCAVAIARTRRYRRSRLMRREGVTLLTMPCAAGDVPIAAGKSTGGSEMRVPRIAGSWYPNSAAGSDGACRHSDHSCCAGDCFRHIRASRQSTSRTAAACPNHGTRSIPSATVAPGRSSGGSAFTPKPQAMAPSAITSA